VAAYLGLRFSLEKRFWRQQVRKSPGMRKKRKRPMPDQMPLKGATTSWQRLLARSPS